MPERTARRAPLGAKGATGRTTGALLAVAFLLVSGLVAVSQVAAGSPRPSLAVHTAGTMNNGVTPPPTESATATFDAADGYVLMFGGKNTAGATLATTWTFTRGNWSELYPVGGLSPPARYQGQMAYDAADSEVVLFGGCADTGCHDLLSDTWAFVHGQWTDLTVGAGPAPPGRDRGMMTYDAADGYVLLFGGEPPNRSAFLADAWTFHAGLWSPLTPTTLNAPIPSARAGASIIFDPVRSLTVLFGGNSATGVLADTWTYRSGNWTDASATLSAAPGPRWAASATYDSEEGYPLLVNGYDNGVFISEAWSFGGSTWSQLSDSGGPDGSFGGVLVDDPRDGYLVYFSGVVAGFALLTATLLYEHGSWILLINPPSSSRFSLLAVFVPLLLLPVVFGISVPLGNRARRRREARLAQGVNLVPGEIVRWIETPRPWSMNAAQVAAVGVIMVIPAAFLIPLATGGLTLLGILLLVGISALAYGLIGAAMVLSVARTMTRAIGVIASGVIVRRSSGELRVGWENLQPSLIRPQKDRYWFQFLFPGKETAQGGFAVTIAQARAILTDPHAPAWILARPVSDGLGLPPRTVTGPASVPLPTGRGPTWTPPTPPGPLSPSAGYVPFAPPAAPPPVPAYPAWTPPPPPSVRPPPPPPAPLRPPGTTPCPRCGQLNPTGRVAFCRSCGQRLM
ncbi:MAG TPA: kelch repeat-containing protein [Thermoplasmata archaeon]